MLIRSQWLIACTIQLPFRLAQPFPRRVPQRIEPKLRGRAIPYLEGDAETLVYPVFRDEALSPEEAELVAEREVEGRGGVVAVVCLVSLLDEVAGEGFDIEWKG